MPVDVVDELIENNEVYARGFEKPNLPVAPARKLAVLACMDARLDPHKILGLEDGDAHVIRNAGGVVTDDAIRSLVISQRVLGTREIILIHHTDCGMLTLRDDELEDQIEAETGVRPPFRFETFSDLRENLRRSIALIAGSPFLPHGEGVRGFIYDVGTGRLGEVKPEPPAGGVRSGEANR